MKKSKAKLPPLKQVWITVAELVERHPDMHSVVQKYIQRRNLTSLPDLKKIFWKMTYQDNFTIVTLLHTIKKFGLVVVSGATKRNPIDHPDYDRGENIAVGRALENLDFEMRMINGLIDERNYSKKEKK